MILTVPDDLIATLQNDARRETLRDAIDNDEDITAYDCVGSNVDDAWDRGEEDGNAHQARDVLLALGIEW
ncbi:hypothetical protein [Stenotrophomonas oahuensis]|uniref:CopG family transcriptional regulator n=1 Tax=Stenotrophomonas oahuensis TaxID=3003271 RepID=A0ABY9YQE9_9GAMM|nr:hypothetical protein [Stenotrophomonas sp. A5586]WNH52439.1 hypothetical protein PDM29_19300 [Stenotrophomonas sp. A5586]